MKKILFILGSELYTAAQIQEAVRIAQKGDYTEVFVPTPDGHSQLSGKIPYSPPLTTFRCGTMIIPSGILTKIKDHYRTVSSDLYLTFCDLIDTWRCEVNCVSSKDAGYKGEVLKRGKTIRRFTAPAYEYPAGK